MKSYTSFRSVPLLMTLKYIWRSFQPRLSFPRPFQLSLACFRVARSPSNSWASCVFCDSQIKNILLNVVKQKMYPNFDSVFWCGWYDDFDVFGMMIVWLKLDHWSSVCVTYRVASLHTFDRSHWLRSWLRLVHSSQPSMHRSVLPIRSSLVSAVMTSLNPTLQHSLLK